MVCKYATKFYNLDAKKKKKITTQNNNLANFNQTGFITYVFFVNLNSAPWNYLHLLKEEILDLFDYLPGPKP